MQTQIKKINNGITWINIIKPDILEIRKILLENNLNDSLAEEIVKPTLTTKVDTMRGSIYLTLHFPIFCGDKTLIEEVDFLIKRDLLITSSYNEIIFIKNYIQNYFETNISKHGEHIFTDLLISMYKQIQKEIEKNSEEIKKIEEEIFITEEHKVIEDIARISKKIFDLYSQLSQHLPVLETLQLEANKIFGFEFDEMPKTLLHLLKKNLHAISNQKENLEYLKNTFGFLLTNKTNQIVKIFTVISFILLPLTFLANFFGMNTRFPSEIIETNYGTIYIMIIMLIVSTTILSYLHWKKFI